VRWKTKRWMTGGALALVAALAAPVQGMPEIKFKNAACQRVCADGPKTCNCTPFDVEIEFCHSEEVEVTVAASVGSLQTIGVGSGASATVTASTGQASSTCAKATVPSGQCVWMRYCFTCCMTSGLFGSSWTCLPDGTSIQGAAASPEDCGETS